MAIDILHCFSEQPRVLDFVLPGFLSGTVGCLAAAGSTGKSFWALEAAMGVASAEADASLLNLGTQHHGRVVVLNAEDPEDILHHRLHSVGRFLSVEAKEEVAEKLTVEPLMGTQPDIMAQRWQDEVLRVSEDARLIVFDTLTRWHRMDENKNADMAQVLSVFESICRRTGAAVLFLHHVGKSMAMDGRQDEQQATRGASAITDNARWQGWMQGMSRQECEAYGIPEEDRKRFVRTGGNKENYGQATRESWLERKEGGVLIPISFGTKGTKQRGKGNDKATY